MSLLERAALATAAIALSVSTALAGDQQGAGGTWLPVAAHYSDHTVLILGDNGRFAALVASNRQAADGGTGDPDGLDAASGTWALAEDGGEVVLAFDNLSARPAPGATRFVQMLLLGDELHPYSGMEDRSPVALTVWRRGEDALASAPEERAAR